MAVLLRSIGIPARVVIGFTAGESDARGDYVVTTQDLHAWVEVPFEGYGWLPFEPTPTRVNPAANSYLRPAPVDPVDDVIGHAPRGASSSATSRAGGAPLRIARLRRGFGSRIRASSGARSVAARISCGEVRG